MAAGHIVNGQCVDAAASQDFYWGSKQADLVVFDSSGTFYVGIHIFTKSASGWVMDNYLHTGTMPSIIFMGSKSLPVVSFGSCDYQPSISGLPADFDYTVLAAVWVFAMSVVVASYVIAKGMGTLIAMFKS